MASSLSTSNDNGARWAQTDGRLRGSSWIPSGLGPCVVNGPGFVAHPSLGGRGGVGAWGSPHVVLEGPLRPGRNRAAGPEYLRPEHPGPAHRCSGEGTHDETIVTVIHKTKKSGSESARKTACIVVIYGSELGRKYDIEGREMTIGRSSTSDIRVDQDSVSRTHATLSIDENGVKIRDHGSTNGTRVNDRKVREAYLKDGDLIKVGRSIFKFLSGENIESAYHEEVYRLSTTDGLTQIFNKRYFTETLEREWTRSHRHGHPLSLMLFDLDHFKRCNDVHGHRAGDYVLREVASIFRDQSRPLDVVARYGGEEFASLMPDTELGRAVELAEGIRRRVEESRFEFEGTAIAVTISVGVAEIESSMRGIEELVQAADGRLYRAKQCGRNQVVSSGTAPHD